jgi:hypothetical protein
METMTKTIHGKVHGRTIELDEDLGVAEGQEVESIDSTPFQAYDRVGRRWSQIPMLFGLRSANRSLARWRTERLRGV